jgi:hypothetical protein
MSTYSLLIFLFIIKIYAKTWSDIKQEEDNFHYTCKGIILEGETLIGNCRMRDGFYNWDTHINLNSCLGNIDGELQTGYRNYGLTCTKCNLIHSRITCECKKLDGNFIVTTLDLFKIITNTNGILSCSGDRANVSVST